MNQVTRSHQGEAVRHPWIAVVALSLGPTVSNGLARFAYALILPAMQSDLHWSYTEAGWLNTANAIGYLFGAMGTLWAVRIAGAGTLFRGGMVVVTAALLASGMTKDIGLLSLLRILAGLAGAPVFICGGVLAAALFPAGDRRAANAIALYFGGAGVGLLLSGIALPLWFDQAGTTGWPIAWIALGFVSGLFVPISYWGSRQIAGLPASASASLRGVWRHFIPALTGYGFFGAGYMIYMTFIVAWARSAGAEVGAVTALWSLLGLAVLVSPFAWRPLFARWSGRTCLALSIGFTGGGVAIAWSMPSSEGLQASAILFGLCFFIAPSAVTTMVRSSLPQPQWAPAVALFTIVFAASQTIGPIAAGWIADLSGTLSSGLLLALGLLLSGTLVAGTQRTTGF
jgi:predicted MFS family arabinose efflux permease